MRLVVLTAIAIGLLVMAERSWNGEESMFRSSRKIDEFEGFRSMELKDETRINEASDYDPPYDQSHTSAESDSAHTSHGEEPVDRWIKITRPAPAPLVDHSVPSRLSPEITIVSSSRTFDAPSDSYS